MEINANEIEVNGVKYVPKSSQITKDGLTQCIVRTYSAGVFLAWVDYESCEFFNCRLVDAIRVWKWAGAFTLSALARSGTTKPNECRFSQTVPEQRINRVIEMIPVTQNALTTFESIERG